MDWSNFLTPAFIRDISGTTVALLVCLSLITGKGGLATNRELKLALARNDLLEKRVDALIEQNNLLAHELVPTLTQFMDSMKRLAEEKT